MRVREKHDGNHDDEEMRGKIGKLFCKMDLGKDIQQLQIITNTEVNDNKKKPYDETEVDR